MNQDELPVAIRSSVLRTLKVRQAIEQELAWRRDRPKPQPGPQFAFLRCEADIAIYGGSAGCGKSRGLLMWPLVYLN